MNTAGQVQGKTPESAASAAAYYETIKSYARHEDGLLNNRINWCLLVNSFLFTALALLTSQADVVSATFPVPLPFVAGRSTYTVSVFSIGLMGALLTLASSFGVVAATLALQRLGQRWTDNLGRFADSKLYPGVLGAGSTGAHVLGILYPLMLIATLLIVWFVILYVCWTGDLRFLSRT